MLQWNLHNEVLGLTNFFFYSSNSKIYGNTTKLTNLVMTNIFCQSLGLSLHRGSTVINFIYSVFIYFTKSRGVLPHTPPPSPKPLLPQRGPCSNMTPEQSCLVFIREYEHRHNQEDWIASVERLFCQTSALKI